MPRRSESPFTQQERDLICLELVPLQRGYEVDVVMQREGP
jgi:hypothetical protein